MIKYSLLTILGLILLGNVTAQIAVKGETIYTVTGDVITNGVILINNGKIEKWRISWIFEDIHKLSTFFSLIDQSGISGTIRVIVGLSVGLYFEWKVALVSFAITSLYFLLMFILSKL